VKVGIVTGGLGFIASHLIEAIKQDFDKIVIVDNETVRQQISGLARNLAPKIELIRGNVQEVETWNSVSHLLEGEILDLRVFHLAAETSTGNSLYSPSLHVETNVLGSSRLCEFLDNCRKKLNSISITLTSTRAVYGEGLWQTQDGRLVVPEGRLREDLDSGIWIPRFEGSLCTNHIGVSVSSTETKPNNVYGSTKLAQELILRNWATAHSIPLKVFRLQNVYGPGQSLWNAYSGVVSLFVRNALSGKSIEVYEEGGIVRDFIYVGDVIKELTSDFDSSHSWIRDIGSGLQTTLFEIAQVISEEVQETEIIRTRSFRLGDVRAIFLNRPKEEMNANRTPINRGIKILGDWAREQIKG
jgi:dTDP-L-rhamnose 4-epimerase